MQGESYTDISISLSTFFMKYVGLWIARDQAEERRRKLATAYTILITLFSAFVEFRDLYFSWDNLSAVLYVSCNILSIALAVLKVYVLLLRKTEFTNLVSYVQEHFWNNSYDTEEKSILANGRKICIFFTLSVTFIGECAIAAYIVVPIVANIGKNESDRILPFNMWIGTQGSLTPYYEIMFAVQVFTLYHVGVCYFCFDNMFCILSVHIATQFRILQYRFSKLCEIDQGVKEQNKKFTSMCYDKFKSCVRQHQKLIDCCNALENVYTIIIFGQVLVFSLLVCLFGYQILLANSSFARRCVFVFLIIGSTSLLYMFTYSCHSLIEQSDQIGTAAYSTMWMQIPMDNYSKMLRYDLIMVMQRSKRICCMTANGFFPVSLETFAKILSTAASYFTLLRNNVEYVN